MASRVNRSGRPVHQTGTLASGLFAAFQAPLTAVRDVVLDRVGRGN